MKSFVGGYTLSEDDILTITRRRLNQKIQEALKKQIEEIFDEIESKAENTYVPAIVIKEKVWKQIKEGNK